MPVTQSRVGEGVKFNLRRSQTAATTKNEHAQESVEEISSVSAGPVAGPAMAEPRALPRAHLVQRGFARWQPGARRADERQPETRAVPDAGEGRFQGNRGRLSFGVQHGVHVQS